MKITALFPILVEGKHVEADESVETTDAIGAQLIADQVAKIAIAPAKVEPTTKAEKKSK